jgi:large repetitive protein
VIDNEGATSSQVDFNIAARDPAPLVADFTTNPEDLTGPAPFTVEATNTSTSADTSIVSVVWDPGDGSALSAGDSFIHSYGSPGSYTLAMQIMDDFGRTAAADAGVTVTLF